MQHAVNIAPRAPLDSLCATLDRADGGFGGFGANGGFWENRVPFGLGFLRFKANPVQIKVTPVVTHAQTYPLRLRPLEPLLTYLHFVPQRQASV